MRVRENGHGQGGIPCLDRTCLSPANGAPLRTVPSLVHTIAEEQARYGFKPPVE
jgi:hypothetical protein